MKVFKSTKGPFSEQPFYSSKEIETLCIHELRAVGLLPDTPAPIRIDRFIEKRFGRAHSYADLEEGVLGLTVFGRHGVQEIVVAESLEDEGTKSAERLLRTTLAHEAGHGLLHTHLFVMENSQPLFGDWSNRQRPTVLCRDTISRAVYKGNWWEYQANMVMGAILMPKHLVEQAVQPFLASSGALGLAVLNEESTEPAARTLAELFDVNPRAVRIRLSLLFPSDRGGQPSL